MAIIFNRPGTFVTENTAGSIPASLASHEGVYMLGYSTTGPTNEPIFITSPEDFDNVFDDASASRKMVAAFFAQRSGAGMYFINVDAAAAYPTLTEIETAINEAFTTEYEQGFILAPEFFANATLVADATDHNSLADLLEAFAADTRFYWVALIDCSSAVANASTVSNFVSSVEAERLNLASPLGHGWYYAPYLVDLADNKIPASPYVAATAIKRFRNEGFAEPPAGTRYRLVSVKGVSVKIDDKTQEQVHTDGINCIRQLPRLGVCIWANRTLSADPYYRQGNQRVVLNVIAGTLRKAFYGILFSNIDGRGALFARIKGTCSVVLNDVFVANGLYGATPQEAYRVICDLTNNALNTLDNGQINVAIYVKVAPHLEFLHINVNKVSLASSFDDVIAFDIVNADAL